MFTDVLCNDLQKVHPLIFDFMLISALYILGAAVARSLQFTRTAFLDPMF